LSVGETGALRRQLEHGLFGVGEVARSVRPQRAAVLQARPEHALEETGRDLVVLRVRGRSLDGDVARPERLDEGASIGAPFLT
jgi:hypothetical protein